MFRPIATRSRCWCVSADRKALRGYFDLGPFTTVPFQSGTDSGLSCGVRTGFFILSTRATTGETVCLDFATPVWRSDVE